jgi:hypothetical protein
MLSDEFQNHVRFNQVIWPMTSGEVIVQHFNAVLALAHLTEFSDGVIITENDHLSEICKRRLRVQNPSFDVMNQLVATSLASVMLPSVQTGVTPLVDERKQAKSSNAKRPTSAALAAKTRQIREAMDAASKRYGLQSVLCTAARQLFSHPGYKLSSMLTIPTAQQGDKAFDNNSWKYLTSTLTQMWISNGFMEEKLNWSIKLGQLQSCKAIGSIVIGRGNEIGAMDGTCFNHKNQYASWVDADERTAIYRHPKPFNEHARSVSIWSNNQRIVPALDRVLSKAHSMFQHDAYIHHYAKYDVGKPEFEDSFVALEQVLWNYKNMA